jgi:hypothetical protein
MTDDDDDDDEGDETRGKRIMRDTFARRVGWRATAALTAALIALCGMIGRASSAEPKPAPAKPAAAKPAAAKPAKPAPVADQAAPTDPVDIAIRNGVEYLYKTQKGDNWEVVPRRDGDGAADVKGAQWGGLTAMATYALLAAGESPQDPRVAKAIKWLDNAEFIGTYAMAMKLQIWNYIERLSPAQKDVLRKDATLLLNGVKTDKIDAGLYHYWLDPTKGEYDQSCSNYGVLGMWAAAQQNLEVPTAYWEMVDKAWRKNQQKDGGWKYQAKTSDAPVTMAMTAAGVATLFITQDMVNEGKGGECNGNVEDKDIDRGLQWIADHYGEFLGTNNLYAMYNLERVGTASGYKYFGTVDWYKSGAAQLLKTQHPDGSWEGGHGELPSTVWAILFLVKGRAPILINKLEYAIDTHGDKGLVTAWNQRPRDAANLTRWAGKQLEKELNWQVVNLRVNVDDLHDAPLLYMAGNQSLSLSKEDKEKLKNYVERGGMILGHADCNDSKFSASFAKLAEELFPGYEFRELPPDHLIYTAHFNGKSWPNKPALRGLSNGARELMVLIPAGDPARYWQIRNFSSVQTKTLAELAANICLYAMDKTTLRNKFKGQTYIVHRNDKIPSVKSVKVARLEYNGNWNPEPGGWRRFAAILHNTRGVDLAVETVKLGSGKLKDYTIAHLTGAGKFKLSDADRKEIKEFADNGGTLIVDAAGGAIEFKESAENEMAAIFGSAAKSMAVLPPDNPVYSIGGDNLGRATYRQYAKRLLVSGMSTPRLRGLKLGDRTGVFYSPEDLSVGLVGMSFEGIYGYEPEYATDLMENIMLVAMGGAPPPKIAPATQPAAESAPPPPKPKEEVKAPEKKPEKKPKKPAK